MTLGDYWQWSASCLMDNTARGILAEFLVATALKGWVSKRPRAEWDPYDFEARVGGRKVTIEVKSSSKVQSWKQKEHSALQFRIARTLKWNPEEGAYDECASRADVYVFCALVGTQVKDHAAALNLDNWEFQVVRGAKLPDQKTISWNALNRTAGEAPCGFSHLRQRIKSIATDQA